MQSFCASQRNIQLVPQELSESVRDRDTVVPQATAAPSLVTLWLLAIVLRGSLSTNAGVSIQECVKTWRSVSSDV